MALGTRQVDLEVTYLGNPTGEAQDWHWLGQAVVARLCEVSKGLESMYWIL